jgi:hypothetical protein
MICSVLARQRVESVFYCAKLAGAQIEAKFMFAGTGCADLMEAR